MEMTGGELTIGCLIYSPRTRMLRASGEMAGGFFRDLIPPAFGGDLSRRFPSLSFYPVPGRPDTFWVVMAVSRDAERHDVLFEPWPDRIRQPGRAGKTLLAVGQISADGRGRVIGPLRIPSGFGRPSGVFGFHPAVLTPGGDLILPGVRITPDMRAVREPYADGTFQGIWADDGGWFPVSGFQIRGSGAPVSILHPSGGGKVRSRAGRPSGGFIMWADPGSGRVMWAIPEGTIRDGDEHRTLTVGRLELVDVLSMRTVFSIDSVCLDRTVFLPDGRWAAFRMQGHEGNGSTGHELLVGIRDSRITVDDVSPPQAFVGIFPADGDRWVLVSSSWFIVMNRLDVEDVVNVPVHPVLHVPGVLVTGDRRHTALIAERWQKVSASGSSRNVLTGGVNAAWARNGLGIVWSGFRDEIVFVPSCRGFRGRCPDPELSAIGDGSYALIDLSDWHEEFEAGILFYDRDGEWITGELIHLIEPDDLIGILFLCGAYVILALDYSSGDMGTQTLLRMVVCDERGNTIGDMSFGWPEGRARIVGSGERNGIGSILLEAEKAGEGKRLFRLSVMITESDGRKNAIASISGIR